MSSVFLAPKASLIKRGYCILNNQYSPIEVNSILERIAKTDTSKPTFRKSNDLFAIRQFLKEVPEVLPLILNEKLKETIRTYFGPDYFIVKSIYFDKPDQSNWFVAYHQDLTISVDKKEDMKGYGPWTVRQNQFAVQPPLDILENIFTIRIHLDDTDENNGALRVVSGSHRKGIHRPKTINWDLETEEACCVEAGGIMIMKPLLLHSSGRTTNGQKRRVIHIEFSNKDLSEPLQWAERVAI